MNDRMTVAVYGASGHTGKFVVAELKRRGIGVVRMMRLHGASPPLTTPGNSMRRSAAPMP
jgi:putative NADH-flavin reductase